MDLSAPGAFAAAANTFNLDCPCCYRPGEPFSSSAPGLARITAAHKLSALRILLAENDLDAYLVFSEDAHNSEYVSECDERRSYLSGFTGSAGVALVTRDRALCWTDSRYFLQAAEQLPKEWTLMKMFEPGVPQAEEEMFATLGGKRVGLDPATFAQSRAAHWQDLWAKKAAASAAGGSDGSTEAPVLVPIRENLVDAIWNPPIRPEVPQNALEVHPAKLAGETVRSKLKRVAEAAKADGNADGLIVSALDQNAWLYNLRGSDIDCNPVFFSYSVVASDGSAHLFAGRRSGLDGEWISEDVKKHLAESDVTLHPYSDFGKDAIAKIFPKGGRILVEKTSCSMAVAEAVSTAEGCVLLETSESAGPVEKFKALKNAAEIGGLRDCSARDSAALVKFSAWLTEQMGRDESKRDDMAEAALAEVLLSYRQKEKDFLQNSFPTISSVGPNSAVVHYCPKAGADAEKVLTLSDIYLLDSGGQYLDGTTDITRTFHFGSATAHMKRCYTRVLQGHIALAHAIFPAGTPGLVLDCLARSPLWRDGLTYGHGTGHGIGARLNVHEGPMGIGGGNQPGNLIRKNPRMQSYYLEPIAEGMYLSNEPGYYLDGKYGFRIESDMIAVPAEFGDGSSNGKAKFLMFDTVTKVPMCRALIDVSLLTAEETEWLNEYHADCREALGPLLGDDEGATAWLATQTAAL